VYSIYLLIITSVGLFQFVTTAVYRDGTQV